MTFDTSATQKVFGPIVIDYHQVRRYSFFFFFFFFFQFTLSDNLSIYSLNQVGGGGGVVWLAVNVQWICSQGLEN